ncbi:MAG: adenylyltransferase/cytidyltransferase family protein [Holosporales bacterium]|jgi:pantetheine-phosphate adenylyltransferase|nr:adenylyltransferase/cytidyltransferase family protein [Holosporales bacterium]
MCVSSQKALFAGTFNPFTIGHASVYARACKIFAPENVFIGIANNPQKPKIDKDRLCWIAHAVTPRALVIPERVMVADFCKEHGFRFLIRSIRNAIDLVYEMDMCHWNRQFGIETLFVPCDVHLEKISSSHVRELDFYGKPVHSYLPKFVFERWKNRPRRILVTGGIGHGKSSFIETYFKDHTPCFDFDVIAKEVLPEDTRAQMAQSIVTGSFEDSKEVLIAAGEKLLAAFADLPEGAVVEASALGSYTEEAQNPLNALYGECVIFHVEHFESSKKRHLDAAFVARVQAIQKPPHVIDVSINDTTQRKSEIAKLCKSALLSLCRKD